MAGPTGIGRPSIAGPQGQSESIGVQWMQIGPAPLRIDEPEEVGTQGPGPDAGMVVDIAIDPRGSTDEIIYIATNEGGIWRSTDGGTSWKPKTDAMPSLSMGVVALDPGNPDIVYAGTGNKVTGGNTFSKGVGIYKSKDRGEHWTIIDPGFLFTKPTPLRINRIVLPAPEVLLVATNAGLFRSIDGGLHFGANMPLFDDGKPILIGDISDLDLDTSSPSTTVYALNRWLLKSTDGGVTFPVKLFSVNDGSIFTQSTQPNNQTMYLLINQNIQASLYVTTNGGANWTSQGFSAIERSQDHNGCQCNYDLTLGVDPQEANRVYIGFQELYVSTDGGLNFGTPAVSSSKIHWDHHALAFSPRTHWSGKPPRLYVGTDGGVAYSADGGDNWSNINEGIATNLFLSIDIGRGSVLNYPYTYGGTQDTGAIEHRPEFPGTDWHQGVDGDSVQVAVSWQNPLKAFSGSTFTFIKTINGGTSWNIPDRFLTGLPFVGSIVVDPNNDSYVYASPRLFLGLYSDLYQSRNSGETFTLIKHFVNTDGTSLGITSIATVKADSNILWVGFHRHSVAHTANALGGEASTWTLLNVTNGPQLPVSGIAINPADTKMVVVVYAGFSGISPIKRTKHVFLTTDNGSTWNDISGTDGGNPIDNLPDLPVHSVVIDPNTSPPTIIVANDAGVLQTVDLGKTWQRLGEGLPIVACKSLALDAEARPPVLRVGTYGRSVFELAGPSDVSINKTATPDPVLPGSNREH